MCSNYLCTNFLAAATLGNTCSDTTECIGAGPNGVNLYCGDVPTEATWDSAVESALPACRMLAPSIAPG